MELTLDLIDGEGVKSGVIKVLAAVLSSSPSPPPSSSPVSLVDSSAPAVSTLEAKAKALQAELEKTKETLVQREKALEANASAMASSVQDAELKDTRIDDLSKVFDRFYFPSRCPPPTLTSSPHQSLNRSVLRVLIWS